MEPSPRLPAIGGPAARALEEAGVRDLGDLRQVGLDHVATLHGVGPKALRVLRQALAAADAREP
ncbi:DNA-binding protein [Rathayibacter sp. PhB151]|uniref:DNA-binding protein n=1 Tax=Rathayibacter sp. PhB151 TaxID=2485189 RepID=UPI00106273C7|nr:DNA-binding protein [Rathayibacter sp. PhB151]